MFTSIRKYLDRNTEEMCEALLRGFRLLLQGLELHAVRGDERDFERFREDIHRVQKVWEEDPAPSDVLLSSGTLLKAIEEYSHRTDAYIRTKTAQLNEMVVMLTSTVAQLAAGSERSIQRLHNIERQIHKASVTEDFQTLRLRLSECLDTLQEEIVEQKKASASTVADLQSQVEKLQSHQAHSEAVTASAVDTVTGLPTRSEAEKKISEAMRQHKHMYAAIFVLERLNLINTRFGYAVGDELLTAFAKQIQQDLSRRDEMFRWRGPAVVALLDRQDPPDQVSGELLRIASKKVAKTIQAGGRSVLLPISTIWAVFPLFESPSPQALYQKLEKVLTCAPGA